MRMRWLLLSTMMMLPTASTATPYGIFSLAEVAEPPSADGGMTTYTYDPSHPVPTIGGAFSGALKRGAYDQREREFKALGGGSENGFYGSRPPYLPLKARPDVVVFQTEPLAEDVEVIGPITVTLYASSTAVDTDFTAKLIDVYPPTEDFPSGFDMNLTDGIFRVRCREGWDREVFLEPGRVVRITVQPFDTSNLFKAGHRLRVDVSSSNYPHFDANPNTGGPQGGAEMPRVATNRVHCSAAHASCIRLPLMRG